MEASRLALLLLLLAVSAPSLVLSYEILELDDLLSQSALTIPPSVRSICAQTRDPDLCVHALHPFLAAVPPNCDANYVLTIMIQAIRKHTKHAATVAHLKSRITSLDTDVLTALKGCAKDDYAGALAALDKAESRLASKDLPGLKIELSAALSGYDYCEEEFTQLSLVGSPVAKYNLKLMDLSKLALDLAQLVA